LSDFVVSNEIIRLMRHLTEIKLGTIRRVEVRGGLPRRIPLGVAGGSDGLGGARRESEVSSERRSPQPRATGRKSAKVQPIVQLGDLLRNGLPCDLDAERFVFGSGGWDQVHRSQFLNV
jgi:hypothetical protein